MARNADPAKEGAITAGRFWGLFAGEFNSALVAPVDVFDRLWRVTEDLPGLPAKRAFVAGICQQMDQHVATWRDRHPLRPLLLREFGSWAAGVAKDVFPVPVLRAGASGRIALAGTVLALGQWRFPDSVPRYDVRALEAGLEAIAGYETATSLLQPVSGAGAAIIDRPGGPGGSAGSLQNLLAVRLRTSADRLALLSAVIDDSLGAVTGHEVLSARAAVWAAIRPYATALDPFAEDAGLAPALALGQQVSPAPGG